MTTSLIKKLTPILLLLIQPTIASPLSEGALKLIQTGNEINSPSVVMSGQRLLLKGMFKFNDLDAAYESSKQVKDSFLITAATKADCGLACILTDSSSKLSAISLS
jgi:hypothetical protein